MANMQLVWDLFTNKVTSEWFYGSFVLSEVLHREEKKIPPKEKADVSYSCASGHL